MFDAQHALGGFVNPQAALIADLNALRCAVGEPYGEGVAGIGPGNDEVIHATEAPPVAFPFGFAEPGVGAGQERRGKLTGKIANGSRAANVFIAPLGGASVDGQQFDPFASALDPDFRFEGVARLPLAATIPHHAADGLGDDKIREVIGAAQGMKPGLLDEWQLAETCRFVFR
jgi:hypothetical protein